MATARGERRRSALVDAARAILEAEGLAAVTHRAVAARAGLPLAATTYYFASRDELVEEALRRLADDHLARARALVETLPPPPAGPERLAAALVQIVIPLSQAGRAGILTTYERYVQAGREPRLRPLVRAWNAELTDLLRDVLRRHGYSHSEGQPRLVLAAIDGLLIGSLVEGDEQAPATAGAALAHLLASLRRSPSGGPSGSPSG